MTSEAGNTREAGYWQMMPPWLWVWLIADIAVLIPAEVSNVRYQLVLYTGHGDVAPILTAGVPYKLLVVFALLTALTYAILAVGAITALFPQLRGRWVERRYRLATSDNAVIGEMQRFVSRYDPAIRLRYAVNNRQTARIYPVGWRAARIAVFLPLLVLWQRDRPTAEAVLLHEMAHRRHGDQFVVGLGSPFTWLIRVWVPAFILLVLVPLVAYAMLGGAAQAQVVGGQGALVLAQPAELLILPIAGLWLAELNADDTTSRIAGPKALQDALGATPADNASLIARSLALLSHPPRRLRLYLARRRPASIAALLSAWPAALIALLVIDLIGALISFLLVSVTPHDIGVNLLAGTRQFLISVRSLVIVAAVLLLLWPALSRLWDRLWSPQQNPQPRPPEWPYLAAAAVPAVLLAASFAPLPANFVQQAPSLDACEQLATWWYQDSGLGAKENADAAASSLARALGSSAPDDLTADSHTLITAAAAALSDLPPGTVRGSYVTTMDDLIASAKDFLANKETAGLAMLTNALTADQKASQLLGDQAAKCRPPARSSAGTKTPAAASGTTSPAPLTGQLTTAELTARLLTTADLSSSISESPIQNASPATSSKPACVTTLDGLSVATPPSPGITQAGRAFTAGPAGPQFEEVLRSFPPPDAASAFTALTRVLDGCARFTVAWTQPPGAGSETVHPTGPVGLGSQSWSAAIVVTEGGVPVDETLVLVLTDSSLLAVQVASAGGPPTALAHLIADLAVAKLSAP